MSLINQMLRDLETRRAAERRQQSGSIFTGLTGSANAISKRHWLPWLYLWIIGLLLVLVAYLAWQRFMLTNTSVATTPLPSHSDNAPAQATPIAEVEQAPLVSTPTPESMAPTTVIIHNKPILTASKTLSAPATPLTSDPAPTTKSREVAATIPKSESTPDTAFIEKRPRPLTTAQKADKAYQQGIGQLREGNIIAAELSLRETLGLDHEHLQARETLGAMLLGAGRVIEANEILEAGRRYFSRNPTLALLMARVQIEQDNISGAVITLEQNLNAAAVRADYLAFLAALYQRALRYNESVDIYQRALAIEPGQGSWWAGLAISLENAGRSSDALKAYQHAATTALPPQLARHVQSRLEVLKQD